MGSLAFFLAFLALPVASFLLVRSITWTVAAVLGSTAVAGAAVTFAIDHGYRWTLAGLQVVLTVALVAVLIAALVVKRSRGSWSDVGLRRQLTSTLIPVALGFAVIAVSRLLAAPEAGLYSAVGFFIRRQYAEDNAKWLDFAGQAVPGHEIAQAVPMGGALQLFMVVVITFLSAASLIMLGGVNEVFVAANSVVYAEFALAALAPLALAPLAEARVRVRAGSREKGYIPAPLMWTGMLVLVVASLAASGLGHLTLQLVMIAVAFWIAVFLVGSKAPHVYALSSLAIVSAAIVWFPLTPVSVLVLLAGAVVLAARVVRGRHRGVGTWVVAGLWIAMIVLSWGTFASTLRYVTDMGSASAAALGGAGGGVRAAVGAVVVPALELLTSQGGTEQVAPALAILVLLAAILAVMFIARRRGSDSRRQLLVAFAPVILIGGYALLLTVVGTWWAGTGPAYGALKTTFLASTTILAVAVPLALMEIDRRKAGVTLIRVAGIVGVIYVLSVDSLMPRAFTYLSPQQWPSISDEEKGYWWPAEVREQAEQTIASLPVGCAYRPQGAGAPSALPNGQTAYSCTRLLAGLSGMDTSGQAIVDWQRREWLTNTPAWDNEYPAFQLMPEDVRAKNLILMDVIDRVVGLESFQSFMDRYKPPWAKEAESG